MRNEDGSLNREKLGSEVFQNAKELSALNRIIHPAVKQKIREEILKLDEGLIVIEAALLVEDHYDEICDELWYVYAPTQERVKRLYRKPGLFGSEILQHHPQSAKRDRIQKSLRLSDR